jgi:cold shock CspA family protein
VIKIMIFIDGTWIYANTQRLAEACGRADFHLDFGKLPRIIAKALSTQMGLQPEDVHVVRTHLFGSYASNYDLRDEDAVQRRLDFFSLLREEYHYEVEIFPVNFKGRRLRKIDRDPRDTFEPREKCVDISLATTLMYFGAIPNAYDVAVAVIGDQDFKPVLHAVRLLGKRVAIASIQGACSPELADAADPDRIRDFDVIWLNDHLEELELKYEAHQRECESPSHVGDRWVWTTFHPRKRQKFYCDACRAQFVREKQEAQQEFVSAEGDYHPEVIPSGETMYGEVKKKVSDRGFGFIHGQDGADYFFHLTDLEEGLDFINVQEGLAVTFQVKRKPSSLKAGAAQRVRPANGHGYLPPPEPGNAR